jgi:DNA-binding beta-propeller fold protein YncE
LAYDIALTPDGKTVYVLTPRGVVPIRTDSRTVLPMIRIPNIALPPDPSSPFTITPDGRTVYVATTTGILPISTATNTAGNPIDLGMGAGAITFAR